MTAENVTWLRQRTHMPEQRPEERVLFEALAVRQDANDPYYNFAIFVQPAVRVRSGKHFIPDLVVVLRSALAVEIDGSSHNGRYAADRSKDEMMRDCNVPVIRVAVEDLNDPLLVADWVDRILSRVHELRWGGAA